MDPNLPLTLARDNKAAELAALLQSGWPVNTGNKVGTGITCCVSCLATACAER